MSQKPGFLPMGRLGRYGLAVSSEGGKVYVTGNGNHGTPPKELESRRVKFDICGLAVIHIPALERQL